MAEKPITPKKGVVISEINGVKYFKLQSPYPGDYTKNCGLLGNEIDENFFFLRSYDIEDMLVDESGKLTLKRVDGSELSVNTKDFGVYSFNFDKVKGELTITYPDGTQDVLGGFLISGYVHVASNETLKGDGSVVNPLGISEVEVTGTYAPAHKLLDMTQYDYFHKIEVGENGDNHHGHDKHHDKNKHHRGPKYIYEPINVDDIPEGEKVFTFTVIPCVVKENSPEYIKVWHKVELPKKHLGKGYRVVTKEFVDTFGLLYNFEGVKKIKEALEATGSQWRIPSREDWAELLNAAEYCDENRNHDTECVNEWTGKDAGARAKSLHFWKKSHDEEYGIPVYGEDNLPATGGQQTFRVFPVGYGEGSRGAYDFDHDVEALHKLASYWTSTEVGCGSGQSNVYTRTFAYDTRKVLQESSKPSSRLSLRLVRDYDYKNMGVREVEKILGHDVPVTLITNEDTDYSKVWTVVNISFSEPQYGGVASFQWNDDEFPEYYKKEVYYINEFDGEKWVKKAMREGDSVVLIDGGVNEDGDMIYNHEWRVYRDGCKLYLVDTIESLREEIKDDFNGIQDELDRVESGAGLDDDGNYINKPDNRYTSEAESLAGAIDVLDENLGKVEDKVDELKIVEVEPTDETVFKSYELHNIDGDKMGVTIDVPKDKAIHSIFTGYTGTEINPETGEVTKEGTEEPERLYFVYRDEKGIYQLSSYDIESFINEEEFKDGLEVVEHDVKVKIDEDSDKNPADGDDFLKVSINGVKLDGVSETFESIEKSVGLQKDGSYVNEKEEKHYIDGTTVVGDINKLDDALHSEEESRISGDEEIQKELDIVEENLGFSNDGEYSNKGNYISGETVTDDIKKLDDSLKSEEDSRIDTDDKLQTVIGVNGEELENKHIDLYQPTYVESSDLSDEDKRIAVPQDITSDEELSRMITEGEEPNKIIYNAGKYYVLAPKSYYVFDDTDVKSSILTLDSSLKNEEKERIASNEKFEGLVEQERDRAIEAENKLNEKIDSEIERATKEEETLNNKIDAEIKRAQEVEHTLYLNDIASNDYQLTMESGLDLKRNNDNIIHITFVGDFGEI